MTDKSSFPIIPWYASLTKEERKRTREKMLEELRITNKLYPHARSLLRKARKVNSIALQGKRLRTVMGGAIYLSARLHGGLLTQDDVAWVALTTTTSVGNYYRLLVKLLGEDYDPDLRTEIKSLVHTCRYIKLTSQDSSAQARIGRMIDTDFPKLTEDKRARLIDRVIERL